MANDDWIDYPQLLAGAIRRMIQDLLRQVARHGLPSGHELYLTYRTDWPGVELPDSIRAQYPEEITIVLRQRFWDALVVEDAAFAVSMQFGSLPARVRVPFPALIRFADTGPGLVLEVGPAEPVAATPSAEAQPDNGATGADANVVSFSRRRPKSST